MLYVDCDTQDNDCFKFYVRALSKGLWIMMKMGDRDVIILYDNIYMGEYESEVQLLTVLNKYLKYYKNIIHLQLSFVETIFQDVPLAFSYLHKIKPNTIIFSEEEGAIIINEQNWKQIERFCLRINEYIDFRIIKSKSIPDPIIVNQVCKLLPSLQKQFTYLNRDINNPDRLSEKTLSFVFLKIKQCEEKCFKNIMKMLIIKTNYIEDENLSSIRYHYNINPINKSLHQEEQQIPYIRRRVETTFRRVDQSPRAVRIRRSTIQSDQNLTSREIIKKNSALKNKNKTNKNNLSLNSQKKLDARQFIADIMNLQKKVDSQNVYRDLLVLNKNNMMMIKKFRKEAQLKKKKIASIKQIYDHKRTNNNRTKNTNYKRSITIEQRSKTPIAKFISKNLQRKNAFPIIKRMLSKY